MVSPMWCRPARLCWCLPGDPRAVAGAVARVLGDDGLAADLRREALAAAAGWGPERMLAEYRQAYRAAVAGEPYRAGGVD